MTRKSSTKLRPVGRHGLSVALLLAALHSAFVTPARAEKAPTQRPNIVIILADDLGYSDLGCYGGEIATPNLDGLAAEGVRFSQFYNCAKCTETRATLLSGLYHHQTKNLSQANHATIAELLRRSGYATMMVGKWHLPAAPPDRGFDRYFGFLGGAANFFTGEDFGTGKNLMRLDRQVFAVPPNGFYTTDAFTDYAVEFLNQASKRRQPFFLYVAHNAPHFPLHAPDDEIAKYRGGYMAGWDRVRARRYERMRKLGLIDPAWPLTPRDAIVPAWDSLTVRQKTDRDLLMAVYAAMVDRLDQNIGRLLTHLDKLGVADNTLVMFLSDNGGCPYDFNHTPRVAPGPADSFRSYNSPWANVSNTPFRLYKQWSHEGGVSTPLIVRWPAVIQSGGGLTDRVGHLIDIMPTCLEIVGAEYPRRLTGRDILPMEGLSLVPVFSGGTARKEEPIYWEFLGNRAVRQGRWKLVAERAKDWELYDMTADRCELVNLIAAHPGRAAQMAQLYDTWANRTGARTDQAGRDMKPSTQNR